MLLSKTGRCVLSSCMACGHRDDSCTCLARLLSIATQKASSTASYNTRLFLGALADEL